MRQILLVTALAALAAIPGGAVRAQMPAGMPGGGMPGSGMAGSRPSAQPSQVDATPRPDKPDVAAQKAYKAAAKALDKAMQYDQLALKAPSADKRADELEKARDYYYRALDMFTEALSNDAEMAEAWNSAGYVHLRLGAYGESIDDYNHALKFKPDLPEAIAHRAEAYMRLDRLDEAQSAYMDLFNHARPLADQLMTTMQRWLEEHRQDPKGMRPTQIDAFDQWLKERNKLASQAPS
ncbi:MAG TPA: tetratricopeptide repeat protein [Steroidobacteraceae bacterium]|nr:tetratricopeptide repeat protein [Steroidobacteraceae bacterium]